MTWRLGSAVAQASLGTREVVLADGSVLAVRRPRRRDRAASVRRLAIPAPEGGRHAVRTLEDAVALRADLRPGARVVVIGAGFIGCEVAATAVGLGCEVAVVAPEAVPMQRPLGPEVGGAMRRRHEAHGVRLAPRPAARVRRSVRRRRRPGRGGRPRRRHSAARRRRRRGARLARQHRVARGHRARHRGRRLHRRLDARPRPEGRPAPDVVAVGDVARFPNALFDDVPRRVEHWSIPTDTAKRAAPALVAGLTGGDVDPAPFAPLPSFWSDQYGARIQSFGSLGVADTVRVLEGDLDGEFVAGYERGGVLVGVLGIGLMSSLMRLRGEIIENLKP